MTKVVPLSKRYEVAGETFDRVTLRDPGFADYRQLGPVYDVVRGQVVTDHPALFAYADRLVTAPSPGAVQMLNLEDTLAVEEAVLGFFYDARMSLNKRTNSSSGSTGAPTTSTG